MIELDPDAKELIGRARDGEGPSESERSRLRAAVAARVGAGVLLASAGATSAAGNASAALGASGASLAAKFLVVSVLTCGLGAAGYVALSSSRTAPPRERAPAGAERAPAAVLPSRPSVPVIPATASAARLPPAPVPASAPAHEPAPRSIAISPLEAETRALGLALTDLREGRAANALSALDAQRARFSQGALAEERAEARIKALCALGRTQEAQDDAARFLAEYPRSLLAGRVRASCGGSTLAKPTNGANPSL